MPTPDGGDALEAAWAALTAGDPDAPAPARLQVTGEPGSLPSRLPVEDVAIACVATALRAAAALQQQRGAPAPAIHLDRAHVAAAVRSEAHFRQDGQRAGASFAPLSRFWRSADGWVRTHANYPWHRAALLAALGVGAASGTRDDDVDAGRVAEAVAGLDGAEVEGRVFAAGGVAAAVRTVEEWRAEPQGRAVAAEPLVGDNLAGGAPPRRRGRADLPAAGVRVLDLTRVIAGPVATRFLGALGAEVLRIDPPGHPDMAPGSLADTLLGKRSAFLDVASETGLARLHGLLDGADVVVHGYRPGSLERFGLGAGALAADHPGLVVVHLDAWGHRGPWSARRGFDSIVQAACGIATREAVDQTGPGALPCQLLDHGTGYLAAAAALDGLRRQAAGGGTWVRSLSLARTATWLTSAPAEPGAQLAHIAAAGASSHPSWLVEIDSPAGILTAVAPPGDIDGRPLSWAGSPGGYGAGVPAWTTA